MKTYYYIWSFDLKALLFLSACIMLNTGCEMRKEQPDKKIFKAKPIDKILPREELKKEELPKDTTTVPSDTLHNNMSKDTTESLHRIEKRPEIRYSRKYFHINIHKKALIT